MEGLRGFAVLLVFFVHYHALFSDLAPSGSLTFKISHFLSNIGHSGVDLFFVLSGYLIYGTVISKRTDYARFMKRRVQRIYPTFLCVFAIYLALSILFPSENKIPKGLSQAVIYLTQNILLLPGLFDIRPIITVAWSLSYELFFYLLIPLLVAGLSMRTWPSVRRSIFFLTAGAVLTVVCWMTPFSHIRLIMFVSGILLYEAIHCFNDRQPMSSRTEILIMFCFIATFPALNLLWSPELLKTWAGSGRYWSIARQLLLFSSFFIVVYACFTSRGLMKTVFSWTPLRWLGNMSYSYYLFHGLALKGLQMVLGKFVPATDAPALFWVTLPISFAITLVASTVLFVLVEKRFSLSHPPRDKAPAALGTVPASSSRV